MSKNLTIQRPELWQATLQLNRVRHMLCKSGLCSGFKNPHCEAAPHRCVAISLSFPLYAAERSHIYVSGGCFILTNSWRQRFSCQILTYRENLTFYDHLSSASLKNSGKPPPEATSCLLQHLSSKTGTVESWPRASTAIQPNAVVCLLKLWIHLVWIHPKADQPCLGRRKSSTRLQ